MRSALTISLLLLLAACASEPAGVAVIGCCEDLTPLTGEWSGVYDAGDGRTGSIVFHLTADPKGAHGDVLLAPRREIVEVRDRERVHPFGGASVLTIEFVRVDAREITGRIAPFPDPEMSAATLETHFAGHVSGNRIEGTFVTYSDHGAAPRRGTWRVRKE